MQYAAGGHWPTSLETIIYDCLQYTFIVTSPLPLKMTNKITNKILRTRNGKFVAR